MRELVEDSAEIVRLPLGVRVVGDVVSKRIDDLVLQVFNNFWLRQPVPLCKRVEYFISLSDNAQIPPSTSFKLDTEGDKIQLRLAHR